MATGSNNDINVLQGGTTDSGIRNNQQHRQQRVDALGDYVCSALAIWEDTEWGMIDLDDIIGVNEIPSAQNGSSLSGQSRYASACTITGTGNGQNLPLGRRSYHSSSLLSSSPFLSSTCKRHCGAPKTSGKGTYHRQGNATWNFMASEILQTTGKPHHDSTWVNKGRNNNNNGTETLLCNQVLHSHMETAVATTPTRIPDPTTTDVASVMVLNDVQQDNHVLPTLTKTKVHFDCPTSKHHSLKSKKKLSKDHLAETKSFLLGSSVGRKQKSSRAR